MPFDHSSTLSLNRRHLRIHPLTWAIAVALAPVAAGALPQDGVIKQGQATIQTPQTGQMVINQSTQTAAVDWRSFSVDKGETVNIVQPNAQAVLINRVIGYDPTRILGQINANGRVVLSNPRGVYFATGSQVDVGSLVATTLSLSDADLQSGRLRFGASTEGAGELRAEGSIHAADAVALIAPQLSANGSIDARRVGLAAASNVTVDVEGDGLVLFNVRNDEGLETRLNQLGTINASQSAELRAVARAGFADTVLNMEGVVRARSLEGVAGRVVVDGGSQGVTWVNGSIDASGGAGQAGGDVLVQGQRIMLDTQAQLDASGDTGGGRIRVGGDFRGANPDVFNAEKLIVRSGAQLNADAGISGNGGQVILWSDMNTVFLGSISAKGGALGGNGGQAEVSGRQFLTFAGSSDLSAVNGKFGQLLLDPTSIQVTNSGTDPLTANISFADAGTNISIKATGSNSLQALLNTQDVVLEATGSISILESVSGSNALTLKAGDDISISAALSASALTLSANDAGGPPSTNGSVTATQPLTATSGNISITSIGSSGSHSLNAAINAAGTLTINGDATIGGTATAATIAVASGTLTLGSSDRLADTAAVTIASGATLKLNGNDTIASLTSAGTLDRTAAGNTLTAATYAFNNGAVIGAALGTGAITSNGAVTLNRTAGASTINVVTGTLTLGNADRLSDSAAVTIGSGATLKLGGNDTIGSLVSAGTLDKAGTNDTLTAGTYALNAGAVVDAKLGAGTITSNGTVSLNDTATATTITVASGTLTLGAADLLANTADVSINSGATLKLGGNDTIRSLISEGTLDKTNINDTLTAGTYALNGGAAVNAKLGTGTINSSGSNSITDTVGALTVHVNSGTLTVGNGGNSGSLSSSATVDGAGSLAFNRSDNFSVGTKFTGGVAVAQAGGPSSTLTLTNTSNDHSGGTSVTSGTLVLGGNNVLGSGAVSINGGTLGHRHVQRHRRFADRAERDRRRHDRHTDRDDLHAQQWRRR